MAKAKPDEVAIKRVVLFGGQGSNNVFSNTAQAAAEEYVRSTAAGAILLSLCHAVFLDDLSNLSAEAQKLLDLDFADFHNASQLLSPTTRYHNNGVIEAGTLCLYQLLHYLARFNHPLTDSFNEVAECAGFCAGLLPAIVVASSQSSQEFIRFGVEAFRLAIATSCRILLHTRTVFPNEKLHGSWSLMVLGLDHAEIRQKIEDPEGTSPRSTETIRLSAILGPKASALTGLPSELNTLKEHLSAQSKAATAFAHVHAWYHGGDHLRSVADDIIQDVERRRIHLPFFSDLKKPVRSNDTGHLLDPLSETCSSLTTWVVEQIVTRSLDWDKVTFQIKESVSDLLRQDTRGVVEIVSFGPGSRTLLAGHLTTIHDPRLEVSDASAFTIPKHSGGATSTVYPQDGIAIVGVGLNLPKGKGPEELWSSIANGLIAVQEIPDSRFELSMFYTEDTGSKPRSLETKYGAFLDDIWSFDNEFFRISPREAKTMDPQQRILLHVAQAALDDAGYIADSTGSFQRSSMGCFIGVATGDYVENLESDIDVFYSPGTLRAFHSGRISYVNKFSGPSIVTDTACSSSFVSIYLACQAIKNGDCTAALAGGVNAICSPDMYLGLSRGHFLSPTGGCKPFDVSADGYCRAEGCVLFVLKPLSLAIKENDHVYGVIKDVMVNQSGNAHSITHPHSETQVKLLSRILERNDLTADSIDTVECHGTGTQAGDTREIEALRIVFADREPGLAPVVVSSIKGNIGHCEAASGAASLAKVLLMLEHDRFPPQAGLHKLNPRLIGVNAPDSVLSIPTETRAWPKHDGLPRRALINNFGAAGSNCVILMEEVMREDLSYVRESKRSNYVFNISARTEKALQLAIEQAISFTKGLKDQDSLADVCYTATARRPLYDYQVSFACDSMKDLRDKLRLAKNAETTPPESPPRVVFVFSGQGGIYPGMGEELFLSCVPFRECILRCDEILLSLQYPSIVQYFHKDPGSIQDLSENTRTIIAQCACVALEYALAITLISYGLVPHGVVGHSLGEYAAIAVSGALSLEETLHVVAARASMMVSNCPVNTSGMVACKLGAREAESMISNSDVYYGLQIACRNSAKDCVISGSIQKLILFEEACKDQGVKVTRLNVPFGFHSPAMSPIIEPLSVLGQSLNWSPMAIPIISTVTGRLLTEDDLDQGYLGRHATLPVRFEEAVECLENTLENSVYIEIGPSPITLSLVRSIIGSDSALCEPTLQKNQPGWSSLSATLSRLSLSGCTIDWRAVFEGTSAKLIKFPSYPLQGRQFRVPYKEPIRDFSEAKADPNSGHVMTGFQLLPRLRSQRSSSGDFVFVTSTEILSPWISGHDVGGQLLCPASIFYEMAIEGAQVAYSHPNTQVFEVRDIEFQSPLLYAASDDIRPLFLHLSPQNSTAESSFKITTHDNGSTEEVIFCIGLISLSETERIKFHWQREAAVAKRQTTYMKQDTGERLSNFTTKVLYEAVFDRVVRYSEEYRTLKNLSVSDSLEGIGDFKLPEDSFLGNYVTPPAFTDTLLHAAGFIANLNVSNKNICMCSAVQSITIITQNIDYANSFKIYCSLTELPSGLVLADAYAMDHDYTVVAIVRGMQFKKLRHANFSRLLKSVAESSHRSLTDESENGNDEHSSYSDTQSTARSRDESRLSSSPPSTIMNGSDTPVCNTDDGPMVTICNVVQSVCEAPIEDLHDGKSLEELGIDSLMQIEITTKLKTAFPEKDIDHTKLWECQSLGALKALLSMDDKPNNTSVRATPSESGCATSTQKHSPTDDIEELKLDATVIQRGPIVVPPLILFHDGSGQISMYKGLKSLGRMVYAFADPDFGSQNSMASITDMAERYIAKLTSSKTFSVILGGWSFGGIVALEAARLLLARGIAVQGLVLIDSPYPINHSPLPNAVISHIVKESSAAHRGVISDLVKEFERNATLLSKYTPYDVDGGGGGMILKTAYLKGQKVFNSDALCGVKYDWLSNLEARSRAVEDWKALVRFDMRVLSVDCDHFEFFTPPYIEETSAQLEEACRFLDSA